ncbi:hypothetical protein ACGFMM_22455 [Streptomyces sp. NPDC048604]|uniref:hypothetical protein n=1 Tax=Streptomyces sp. NPDC048604 TaxID=3365578 RepID=UPI00371F42A8
MSDETREAAEPKGTGVLKGTEVPSAPQVPGGGGRELTAGLTVLSAVVAVVSLLTGGLMAAVSLTDHVFGAWTSPEALTPGLIGAGMAGVAPGLFAVGRARAWEEVRTLVVPTVIVLVGLFAVTVLNAGELQAAVGGSLFLVLFSLGWVVVLALLASAAVVCVLLQYRRPAAPRAAATVPMPGWSKPFLAVLGSGWLGIGAGLLFLPGFWAEFVPWTVGRADAQGLGVWGLALGAGVLGSLAEDDLARVRPALIAVPGVAVAAALVLAAHASEVDWSSGPGLCLVALLTGLLSTGLSGEWIRRRATTAHSRQDPAEAEGPSSGSGPDGP